MDVDNFLDKVNKYTCDLPDDFSLEDTKKEVFDFLKKNNCEIFPMPDEIPFIELKWTNCSYFSIIDLLKISGEVSKKIFYYEEVAKVVGHYEQNEKGEFIKTEIEETEILELIKFGWLVDKTFYSITYKTYDENEDNKIAEPIPEDKLCIRCKKNQRSVFDKELCDDCRFELIKLAEVKSREIREELKKDNMFKCLTSQEKAVAYVKDKYKKELSENKSLFLTSLAREEYNLTKINKI
jgi:hypothetical protein